MKSLLIGIALASFFIAVAGIDAAPVDNYTRSVHADDISYCAQAQSDALALNQPMTGDLKTMCDKILK
jgi:hypothetical protein